WVVRDVTFAVEPGESVAILGGNGAGKSTILRLVAGITAPTQGRVSVRGRLTAMLELGMGFHAEFSGEQNVQMTAQLYGLRPAEIRILLPRIREFSELGDQFLEPLRTYSSGMNVRLAFSLATAVRPDVLIIDEALAVGDQNFQQKSLARIRELQDVGTSLLFVSHDAAMIPRVCKRALVLDRGSLSYDGSAEGAIAEYGRLAASRTRDNTVGVEHA
ncbi:MAG: ATP-binding cassette domain-containing protein, partial [Pseudomonadota bacterium]|nr:ATP-binding cassette domain-containing protein [Pseudomonadota bacterium]